MFEVRNIQSDNQFIMEYIYDNKVLAAIQDFQNTDGLTAMITSVNNEIDIVELCPLDGLTAHEQMINIRRHWHATNTYAKILHSGKILINIDYDVLTISINSIPILALTYTPYPKFNAYDCISSDGITRTLWVNILNVDIPTDNAFALILKCIGLFLRNVPITATVSTSLH